jgi:AmmeMemoRadiSam system protein B
MRLTYFGLRGFSMKKDYKVRHPVVSGLFYPDTGDGLSKEIESYIERVDREQLFSMISEQTGFENSRDLPPIAVVAPHAGYIFSGAVQAYSYAVLEPFDFDTVVIAGPAHQAGFEGICASTDDAYRTPLGEVELDVEFIEKLLASHGIFQKHAEAHLGEHSVEVQVPFVQHLFPGARIVPLLLADQTEENANILKDALHKTIQKTGRKTVFVASSDLSHYHAHVDAKALDNVLIDAIRTMDPGSLYRDIQDGKTEACGFGVILAAMLFAAEHGKGRSAILKYTDSGEMSGDRRKVVGYLSAVLY